jgi:hypothetical protein
MLGECVPNILIICGDPGGANALVPVIRRLKSENIAGLQIFAYREAMEIMSRNDILFSHPDEAITNAEIEELLGKNRPDIIVTGTSVNFVDLEKKFIGAARKLKIPCLALLDFWANYSQRFSDDELNLIYVPDKIAIMDDLAFNEMVAEGFCPETLVITGQPAFDTFADQKWNFTHEMQQKIRCDLQINPNELFILFVSQELAKWFGDDDSNPQFLGYTEHTVLHDVIPALEQISRKYEKPIVMIIRPHPCEKPDKYGGFNSDSIRISVSAEGDPRDIVMGADLIIGMNTMLLVESCYLGSIVVSVQPGLRFKDFIPTNLMGYSIPVYSREKILETLEMALMNIQFRAEMKKKVEKLIHEGNATTKVVNTIYQMIKQTNYTGWCYDKAGN